VPVDADHALATWLSRRLTLAGFRTWCRGTAPIAGEDPDDSVRKLIELRGCQYVPVVSVAGLSNALFLERCTLAAAKESFVLPGSCTSGLDSRLSSRMKSVAAATVMQHDLSHSALPMTYELRFESLGRALAFPL
jgi:hypothetical protein